ncbi:hypothetical protein BH09MYX1_BH09MYX1_07320 [soil metagenome]
MRRITFVLGLCGLTGVTFAVACGSSTDSPFLVNDGGTSDVTVNEDAPVFPTTDSSTDGTPSCTQCSGDLKSILTCGDDPQVVQTCTGDLGCGPTGCINACDAAAANKSSIGCDYYAIPSDSTVSSGSCYAAFVTNTWSAPMKVTLSWKGTTIDATPFSYIPKGSGNSITYQAVPSTGIPSNNMAIVFLNNTNEASGLKVECPAGVKVAVTNENLVLHGTNLGHAMEIQTSVPAVVYDIYPYGGAKSYISSATLLLPTTSWDTNYVAATMGADPASYTPGVDLVAREDGTQITLLPSISITAANGVTGATKGVPVVYSANKGQTIHLMQVPDGTGSDLSGSIIQSNKPVGVWGEHFCMFQPNPPKWRILGAAKGTTLTYDPPVAGAPTALTTGQLVEFDGPGAFHVKSQDNMHPFYLAAHRPGSDCDAAHQQIPPVKALGNDYVAVANEATGYGIGGPETVNVVPPAQFLSSYIFFTDPTYGNTDLALVRKKASDATFKDVTLDCLGTVTGWLPIGGTDYQYTHVDVQHLGAKVGACDNGLHTIKSDAPFGITVWGYDSASSYAYPAGASVKSINTFVVPPVPN